MFKQAIVTGSLAFDQVMRLPGKFKDHILPEKLHILNVSFLVDSLEVKKGGTGGNISYNLALLGVVPKLIAVIGRDGQGYLQELRLRGVDVSGVVVVKDLRTAVGVGITDKDDNQIWAFYTGAMRRSEGLSLQGLSLQGQSLVVIAPNDPKAVVKQVRECVVMGLPFLYDPAFQIPHYSKAELKYAISHAAVVVGNDYEISLLQDKSQISNLKSQNRIVITTLGVKGSVIEQGAKKWRVKACKIKKVVDPTGAGDAYRAGFVAGLLRDLPLRVCGQMGSVAAAYTVENQGTQEHEFSLREFKKRYKFSYQEELDYD